MKIIPICVLTSKYNMTINGKIARLTEILDKFVMTNEGSHTQLISYLNNSKIHIKVSEHIKIKKKNDYRKIRYAWLETSTSTKMTFARSLWRINKVCANLHVVERNIPIGTSFITKKIDINKETIELQNYYCYDIEKYFNSSKTVFSKKYNLTDENQSNVIIQEFFCPTLLDL